MDTASQTEAPIFSSGMVLANFVASSDILTQSLETLAGVNSSSSASALRIHVSDKPNRIIIAFALFQSLHELERDAAPVSSETLDKGKFPFCESLSTNANPSFSILGAAATAFESAFAELEALCREHAGSRKPLIITGHSLGGAVASLFTLCLLGRINQTTTKLPLCITFGAPLIGDTGFQKAISEHLAWKSCFLHVVSKLDPIPRFLATAQNSPYKPFGTFLLTSQSGCACFNDPQSVLLLLEAIANGSHDTSLDHYGQVVEELKRNLVVKGRIGQEEWFVRPQHVGIASQLEALGIRRLPYVLETLTNCEDDARKEIEKENAVDPSKKLNDMKINMAQLEWYKKKTQDELTGYYDAFKNPWDRREYNVKKYKTMLTNYWITIVAQAEQKPQREGATLRTRYIGAGTNYRRMVEPLDIAEYYKNHGLNYIANRPEHYTRLEKWLKTARVVNTSGPRTAACSLTEDSCFWARVEEAIIWCRSLSNGGPDQEQLRFKLAEFEGYVMWMKKHRALSAETFLEQSSFMKWWREYEQTLDPAYGSTLVLFMRSLEYLAYS